MRKYFIQSLIVILGVSLIGMSINLFFGPHNIAAGGITGVGVVVEKKWGIDRATIVFIINLILLIMALVFLGKEVFLKSVFGSMMLPVSLALIPKRMILNDKFISIIYGSVLLAIGVVLLYRINASSGGTTIPPLIFKKYFSINTSISLFVIDGIIVVLSLYVFGLEEFLLAILSISIITFGMNYIEEILNRKKQIMVFSSKKSEISEKILNKLKNGATSFIGQGEYTQEKKEVLMVISSEKDSKEIIKIINEIDNKALITVQNIVETHGKGFEYKKIV